MKLFKSVLIRMNFNFFSASLDSKQYRHLLALYNANSASKCSYL